MQVEAIDARPEFDLFTYCELAGETRLEHDLLEELEPRFDDWSAKYLRAYRITDPAAPKGGGHIVLWLEEPVESEIEGIWQDSPSAGMSFHNLAIHMVMSAAQALVPELADKGCAPLPKPTAGVLKAFEKLGLVWNTEGTVNRQFAVFTRSPYSDGCSVCILRPKCPNARDDD
ncbi:MAG: hypothetical protein KKA55_10085 [Proteobacteria bacterium]|nr:hypothetical protein [Pseudomonadota bacterium]MBU1595865.1 hypothetical protein [Pseudomonadota bacterium]